MRRAILLALALLATSAAGLGATAAGDSGKDVLEFDTMTPVVEPFTGHDNAIRGVDGGGVPWELDRARGRLRSDGRLDIKVEGLVLARREPVPEALRGVNPVAQFRAIVSCLTPDGGDVATVNTTTEPVTASRAGDARIRTDVDLPEPCVAPIVFVTSPTEAWFASTGM